MIKQIINKILNINKASTKKEGTVKFFNKTKGFGFITVKDSKEDIFVHKSNLIDQIKENDDVIFEVEKDEKGLSAIKVSLL